MPSKKEGDQNAAPLVAEHRAIVNSMRTFRDELLAVARGILEASAEKE